VEISWVEPDGKQGPRVGEPGDYFAIVRVAPDERSAALALTDPASGTPDLWLIDLARGSRRRLTLEPAAETFPLWSPDGKRMAYSNDRGGGDFALYLLEPGSSTPPEALVTDGGPKIASSWSPDGGELCYNVGVPGIGTDIWIVSLRDRKTRPFLASRFTEAQGTWSPDGRWLAYVSDESGRNEVHVVSYPEGAGRWQVSADGGDTPVWSRDGRTIFWRTGSGDVMAADVQREGAALSFGQPRRLFTRPDLVTFDVAPHSGRFLIMTDPELASSDAIALVLNWPDLIGR